MSQEACIYAGLDILQKSVELLQKSWSKPIVIEIKPLENYYPADEYHQKYLDKNPGGYCHISKALFQAAASAKESV